MVPPEQIAGGSTLPHSQDQLWSTRAVTDAAGHTQASYQYAPRADGDQHRRGRQTFLFADQFQDTESGLYFLPPLL
jgi:hypothetical protein